jgi:hypothetical protein
MPTKRKMKPSHQAVSFFERRSLTKAGENGFSHLCMLVPGSDDGVWPSGKATAFGAVIRGFESLHPSHDKKKS